MGHSDATGVGDIFSVASKRMERSINTDSCQLCQIPDETFSVLRKIGNSPRLPLVGVQHLRHEDPPQRQQALLAGVELLVISEDQRHQPNRFGGRSCEARYPILGVPTVGATSSRTTEFL